MSQLKTMIILATILVAGLAAQEKKVVIHASQDADDKHRVLEELKYELNLSDSIGAHVIVHRRPVMEKQAARIIIKKSGFFRKGKIVIDFDPRSKKILKVTDNGEDIPEKKFHKYQKHLGEATELEALEALHSEMQELEMNIELSALSDSQKLADLEKLIIKLEGLESDHAMMKKGHFNSVKRIIELESLSDMILKVIETAGVTPPQKIEEITIEDNKFYINGEEIEGELGQQCIQAYLEHSQVLLVGDKDKHELHPGEISIKIIMDE